jgi:ectoine hydroxylase-related dioxygenase (phytanoyl-CoA dioxygenase family)
MRIQATTATSDAVADGLRRDGYAVVEGILSGDEVARARDDMLRVLETTRTGRNDFEGFSTRRVYALFKKTRAFDGPAVHPLALGVLDRVLGPHYQLSAPVGIQIGPDEKEQVLHRDEAVYPLPRPHPPVVINTMWPLDDFTEANGATRLVARSHEWAPDRLPDASSEMIVAEMPAGSVMFYLGNLWHGGGANRTDRPRLGVILEYVVAWLRPQENHCLAVPRRIARTLSPRLQELLGYNVFPPFVGYVDGSHPRKVLDLDE